MDARLTPIPAASAALLLLVLACSTPASRIEDKQDLFDGYSSQIQQAIRAGRVTPGMTEDAVWMALGDPDRKSVESTQDGDFLVWIYTRSQPGFGVSVGGGSYGGSGVGGGVGVGRGSEREYEAVVRFKDGLVSYVNQATE
jgi:hypothetical protein